MVTHRSKTLSKTDLLSWHNEAIARAFERDINTADIAHTFDVTQQQVQRLRAQWREDGDIAPVQRPGCPHSAQHLRACHTIRKSLGIQCKLSQTSADSVASQGQQVGLSSRNLGCGLMHETDNRNLQLGTRISNLTEQGGSCAISGSVLGPKFLWTRHILS